ncbi:MAG: BolA family transcriptional regulator [Rhodospirillales bacterium]|nr:BolA family transcriptional regulator [Rhodospirillales bacterium]
MAMDAGTIKAMIEDSIPDCEVRIEDLRGDGDHYAAYITAPCFAGKNRVQQHQMVYAALGGKMGNELHALAIKTAAPGDN